jgi:5-methylthioadenosine/S-adenosylhomocysteine deaminase
VSELLLRNGLVVPGARDAPLPGTDILVRDGVIVAIGRALAASPQAEVVDASGHIAIPGLVNAHTHSNEAYEQGAYDNLPLEPWLLKSYPPFNFPALSERTHYLRAMLTAIESVRSGVTTLQDDLIHLGTSPRPVDAAMTAYRDIGLRARVTASMWNKPILACLPFLAEIVPPDIRQRLEAMPTSSDADLLAMFDHLHRRWNADGDRRLGIILGPCAPQLCSTALLERVAEISADTGLPMHMHVLETKTQAVNGQVTYGRTLIRFLHDVGLLCARLTMNHAIWLTAEDVELMGAARVSTTHNPLSNLKLGSGVCAVGALGKAGVNVALGTDGLTTGDSADHLATVRLAALLHKIESFDPADWLGAADAFDMATVNGARSCMIDDIGRLETGRRADIVLFDAKHWAFLPLHDPVRQICFSAGSEAVRTVIVDGTVIMRDRKLTRVDEAALREEIAEDAERFRVDHMPGMAAGAAVLAPYVDEVHRRAAATELAPGFVVMRSPRIGGWA